LYSIAATTRPILQKSPPARRRQSKENKAATTNDKHDLENGEVLRQKFKDWEIELEG
jgi:hypothetical protein